MIMISNSCNNEEVSLRRAYDFATLYTQLQKDPSGLTSSFKKRLDQLLSLEGPNQISVTDLGKKAANVTYIDLTGLNLATLPPIIYCLHSLRSIILFGNKKLRVDFSYLIDNCKDLQTIYIEQNHELKKNASPKIEFMGFHPLELEQMHFQETIDYALRFVDSQEQIACFAKARSRIFSAMGLSERGISQKKLIVEFGENARNVTYADFSHLDLKELPVVCFLFQNLQTLHLQGNTRLRFPSDIAYQWHKLSQITVEPWSKITLSESLHPPHRKALKWTLPDKSFIDLLFSIPGQQELFTKALPMIARSIGVNPIFCDPISFLKNHLDSIRKIAYLDLSEINVDQKTSHQNLYFLYFFESLYEIDISKDNVFLPLNIKKYCKKLHIIQTKMGMLRDGVLVLDFLAANRVLRALEQPDEQELFFEFWDEIFLSLYPSETKIPPPPINPSHFISSNIKAFREARKPNIDTTFLEVYPAFLQIYK